MQTLEEAAKNKVNAVMNDIKAAQENGRKLDVLKDNINRIVSLPLDVIELDENIRHTINQESESFKSLVASIKQFGILENAIVELRESETGYRLVCVAGHRRILAAKHVAQITKIPCLIKVYDQPDQKIGASLAENLLREDLHCLDVADGYAKLLAAGWSREKIMEYFDRDQVTIRYYLKMASWPEEAKAIIRSDPNIFSTRLLMHKFACRKFLNDEELITLLKAELIPPAQKAKKPKTALDGKLTEYLDRESYPDEIRSAIWRAFCEFGFVKAC
jgi:ParB/RepB/Spo0J family partition protein